jgi:hypothetical protein
LLDRPFHRRTSELEIHETVPLRGDSGNWTQRAIHYALPINAMEAVIRWDDCGMTTSQGFPVRSQAGSLSPSQFGTSPLILSAGSKLELRRELARQSQGHMPGTDAEWFLVLRRNLHILDAAATRN